MQKKLSDTMNILRKLDFGTSGSHALIPESPAVMSLLPITGLFWCVVPERPPQIVMIYHVFTKATIVNLEKGWFESPVGLNRRSCVFGDIPIV
jgi:hypothetical protein